MSKLEESFAKELTKRKIKFEREVVLFPPRKFRVDFVVVIRRKKFAIEVNGGIWLKGRSGHSSGKGIARDAQKQFLAVQHGYIPLIITTDEATSPAAIADYLKKVKG